MKNEPSSDSGRASRLATATVPKTDESNDLGGSTPSPSAITAAFAARLIRRIKNWRLH